MMLEFYWQLLGPILHPNTGRTIANRHRIQTPVNPMTIFGHFNFARPEEWPSIWARIWVFLWPAFTPKAELHNVASPTWFVSSVTLKGYKMSIISFPRPKKKLKNQLSTCTGPSIWLCLCNHCA